MRSHSTTLHDDAERLREELPEGLSAALVAGAGALEGAARLGLEATVWPLFALPRSLRDGIACGLRASVASSALPPHALARAAVAVADRLGADSDQGNAR